MIEQSKPTRIGRRFEALRAAGELGIVAFVTAGDPSPDATERIVPALAEAGADVIELGVPFSDPIADGPVIQRASERALRAGTTLRGVVELVALLRRRTEVPLVLFSYLNPILQMGLERFARESAAAGADGVLVTDVTPEEFEKERQVLRAAGLDTIFLAAPTTTPQRLAHIGAASSGFLYLISRAGVTGERDALPAGLPELIRRVRAATPLPIAVGFGISQPGHVSVLGGLADAAVVGSALVAEIERAPTAEAAGSAAAEKVRALKRAARAGMSRRAVAPQGE